MSQNNPAPSNSTPSPAPAPASAPATAQAPVYASRQVPPVQEEVLYDGPPAWVGRLKPFVLSWLIALALLAIPIFLQAMGWGLWWLIVIGLLAAIAVVVGQTLFHKTLRYRITNYRIDFERGILTRRIDSLELWHADDLYFKQNLLERMMGLGSIDVVSDDKTSPRLVIRSVPDGRALFEKVKLSVLNVKRQRGLLELDQ